MKNLICLFFIFLAFQSHADAVEDIPGASRQEREIRWLWKHLPKIIKSCSRSSHCQKPEVKKIIDALLESKFSNAQSRLKFVSESANPGLFKVEDENHRVMVTETRPDAPIYINTDRMTMDRNFCVGLLAHEVTHNLGLLDDALRLPDQVGAAIASHFESAIQESTLAEFGHPETGLLIFNDPSGLEPALILSHFDKVSIDQNATPNDRVPICKAGDRFIGQKISSPLWRAVEVRGDWGQVHLRGSAQVVSLCRAKDGSSYEVRNSFSGILLLKYFRRFEITEAWWELKSVVDMTLTAMGVNDTINDEIDLNRTFTVESIQHSQDTYQAGDTWKSTVVLRSTDGFVPSLCFWNLSAQRWFFHRTSSTSMFEISQTCQMESLGENRYRLTLSHDFPKNAQGDNFYISMIGLMGNNGEARFAIPARPKAVRLENKSALPRLKFKLWSVQGVPPRETLMGLPLKNSFQVETGQIFWLEALIEGKTEQIGNGHYLDVDFIVEALGDTFQLPQTFAFKDKPNIVLKTEIVKQANGIVLRAQVRMPEEYTGYKVLGFKLNQIIVQTTDYGWAVLNVGEYPTAMFVTSKLKP